MSAAPRGLPEALPAGERILWQGAPRWQTLALRALHARKLAIYFGILLVWRGATALHDGRTPAEAATAVLWLLPLAAAALGLVLLLAWLSARTTVYTITDRRVVMRIGIVLGISLNLPHGRIASAALRTHADGTGDIPLQLKGDDRIAYVHLWPHARPWRFARTEPMLRAIPDAGAVAKILSRALADATGGSASPIRVSTGNTAPAAGERGRLATAGH